ncbi:MAG: VOC family protein [Acidimicrobiia bacterium]
MTPDSLISFLPSTDLDRSEAFYVGVLGLDLVLDQGSCRIFRVTDSAYIGVCTREGPADSGTVVTTIVADDVDGWHKRITDAGWAAVTAPEHSAAYRLHHFWVTDPDGNRLEVQRFDDPQWAASASS